MTAICPICGGTNWWSYHPRSCLICQTCVPRLLRGPLLQEPKEVGHSLPRHAWIEFAELHEDLDEPAALLGIHGGQRTSDGRSP